MIHIIRDRQGVRRVAGIAVLERVGDLVVDGARRGLSGRRGHQRAGPGPVTGMILVLVLAGGWLVVGASARYRLRPGPWHLRLPRRLRRAVSTETVAELIEALRDELTAGTALRPSFERAVASTGKPAVPQALAVCRMGGDVPDALREDAGEERLLVSLAALWQVSEGSGRRWLPHLTGWSTVRGIRHDCAERSQGSSRHLEPLLGYWRSACHRSRHGLRDGVEPDRIPAG